MVRVENQKHEKPEGFEVENRAKSSSRQEEFPPAIISAATFFLKRHCWMKVIN
jgi:hypothetical protein